MFLFHRVSRGFVGFAKLTVVSQRITELMHGVSLSFFCSLAHFGSQSSIRFVGFAKLTVVSQRLTELIHGVSLSFFCSLAHFGSQSSIRFVGFAKLTVDARRLTGFLFGSRGLLLVHRGSQRYFTELHGVWVLCCTVEFYSLWYSVKYTAEHFSTPLHRIHKCFFCFIENKYTDN